MKKLLIYILGLFTVVSFYSCHLDPDHVYVTFHNHTNDTLYVFPISPGWDYSYEDITLGMVFDHPTLSDCNGFVEILPRQSFNEITYVFLRTSPLIYNEKFYDGIYLFVVMKKTTLDQYSKEYLIENNIMDYRLLFTYDEIINMGYKIVLTNE